MRVNVVKSKLYLSSALCLLVMFSATTCRGTDNQLGFDDRPQEMVPFGKWSPSSPLRFRVMKVEELESLETDQRVLKAPGNSRFVLVTLTVIPATKGEGTFHFTNKTALVDEKGNGYQAPSSRFTEINPGALPVKIESGWFVEKVIPFLVKKSFQPHALRCESEDGQVVYLRLQKE
jgi:hypothetical protein